MHTENIQAHCTTTATASGGGEREAERKSEWASERAHSVRQTGHIKGICIIIWRCINKTVDIHTRANIDWKIEAMVRCDGVGGFVRKMPSHIQWSCFVDSRNGKIIQNTNKQKIKWSRIRRAISSTATQQTVNIEIVRQKIERIFHCRGVDFVEGGVLLKTTTTTTEMMMLVSLCYQYVSIVLILPSFIRPFSHASHS